MTSAVNAYVEPVAGRDIDDEGDQGGGGVRNLADIMRITEAFLELVAGFPPDLRRELEKERPA